MSEASNLSKFPRFILKTLFAGLRRECNVGLTGGDMRLHSYPNQKEGEREQGATKIDERFNAVYSI